MDFVFIVLVVSILSVLLISSIRKTRQKDSLESEKKLEKINSELELKQKQLVQIIQQIENHTIDKSVALRNIEIKVLDMYDNSGIRIPTNILEDLVIMKLNEEKEILDFIENQRYYWKLECTKKPFKRG